LIVLLAAGGAKANPDLETKRAQARATFAQVQELDAQVGAAAERWNGANLELGSLRRELHSTRVELRRARTTFRVAQERVASRLVDLYVSDGRASAVEVVLGATSLSEAIDLLDTQQRVAEQDAQIAGEVKAQRERVERREARIARARSRQQEVVTRRASERAAIEAKLQERQRLLATVEAEVRQLQAQERARQADLRRRALAELARQRREQAEAEARAEEEAREQEQRQTAQEQEQQETTQEQREAAEVERAPLIAEVPAEPQAPIVTEAPTPAPVAPTDTPALSEPDPPPPSSGRGTEVVAISMGYLGIPYKWGGASPSTGFDCSGFTMYVFAQVGVSLPHYAAAQFGMGVAVSQDQLEPGDLVFFRGLGHMGMYIGGGNYIHSPQTGDVVKISSLSESYAISNWVGARRVL